MKVIAELNHARIVQLEETLFRLEKDPEFSNLRDEKDNIKDDTVVALGVGLEDYLEMSQLEDLEENLKIGDVLTYILSNAEEHGNKYDPSKVTLIKYTLQESPYSKSAELVVTDQGKGFDHDHLRKCAELEGSTSYNDFRNKHSKHSVGAALFEILQSGYQVSWNKKGNEITIKKTFIKDFEDMKFDDNFRRIFGYVQRNLEQLDFAKKDNEDFKELGLYVVREIIELMNLADFNRESKDSIINQYNLAMDYLSAKYDIKREDLEKVLEIESTNLKDLKPPNSLNT